MMPNLTANSFWSGSTVDAALAFGPLRSKSGKSTVGLLAVGACGGVGAVWGVGAGLDGTSISNSGLMIDSFVNSGLKVNTERVDSTMGQRTRKLPRRTKNAKNGP